METQKNIYTNNPQILPLTDSLASCAINLVRWMHSAAVNGVDDTHPTPPPNLTDSADDPCGLDPDYRHHDLCPDAQDTFWFYESIKRNGFMAGGIVNLNRRMYLAGGDGEASRDDAYYSTLSVRMLFQDSLALTHAWADKAVKNDTTIDADTLAAIDEITARSIDMLSSFTDLLAGVDPVTTLQVLEVLDLIISEINNIDVVIDRDGKSRENQLA